MTGSGAKISRQLNERLPLDAQLPQRLFVSRTLTLATLCPMRIANGRARRVSSAWARVARWSRTRRGICCGSPRTQISPPAIITGGAQGSRDRRIRCGTPSTGTIAPSTNGTDAGQGLQPGDNPSLLAFEKTQAERGWDALRQHQLDPAIGGVDPQPDAPRPRADSDRHRDAKVERRRLPTDLGQRRFAARCDRTRGETAKTRHFAAFAREFADPCAKPSQKLSAAVLIPQARWR